MVAESAEGLTPIRAELLEGLSRVLPGRGTIDLVPTFPSMKAAELQRLLERDLGYVVHSQRGSHRKLKADGRPTLTFAFHDGQEIPPGLVRKVLRDAGLTDVDAASILGIG